MDALSTQIASKKFDVVRKGYDTRAVDGYLDRVGALVAKLEDELRVARSRIEALEKQTKDVKQADTVVETAFLAAAESKAKLMADAEAKAVELIAEAEKRAERMVQASTADAGQEAEALLLEARRKLAESEMQADQRRAEAEREAAHIIAAARRRAATPDPALDGSAELEPQEAGLELQRLMETLGALREAARDGLSQVASIEADIDAAVGDAERTTVDASVEESA